MSVCVYVCVCVCVCVCALFPSIRHIPSAKHFLGCTLITPSASRRPSRACQNAARKDRKRFKGQNGWKMFLESTGSAQKLQTQRDTGI